jgi:serine phosphatase RsbU (regulator of sigma subunit)
LEEGTPLLASNAQVDDRLSGRQSIMALGLRSILCVPLQHKGETLGVVYVDNRLQSGIFTPDDLDLLRAIASSAAVAIENARLYQVSIEKARLERELQVARQVQVSLLPRSVPQRAGWEFAASWQPALEVAGDFYDFVHLDGNHLAIVVADVADKGMPAALFMATTRTTIRTMLTQEHSPGRALTLANQLLCDDASHGMFVTVFCAVLELGSGRLRFANAGHNPPIVCGGGASPLRTLGRTGMALGIERESLVDEAETRLGNGDFVASYTDGVTEACSPGGEQFGVSRLEEILQKTGPAAAQAIVDSVGRSVLAFCGSHSLLDDMTLVVARRDA